MNRSAIIAELAAVGLVLFYVFYYAPPLPGRVHENYISVIIFLFALLASFFISRQAERYKEMVLKVAKFNGTLTFLYTGCKPFDEHYAAQIKDVVKKHCKFIQRKGEWDAYFKNKSCTIDRLTEILYNCSDDHRKPTASQQAFLGRVGMGAILELNVLRRQLIELYEERIPPLQWTLIILVSIILVGAVAVIPSQGDLASTFIKTAFSICIISVIVMLHQLNRLVFFEDVIGESSGNDVLEVLEGKK